MVNWVPNDSTNAPGGAGQAVSLSLTAALSNYGMLYCPSARIYDPNEEPESTRNRQLTYSRGYKEVSTYKISGGTPWRRRRIVFTLKGLPSILQLSNSAFVTGYYTKNDATIGYVRQMALIPTSTKATLHALIFKGTSGNDWTDPMLAKVDTQRISVMSDTTVTFNPGNETGNVKVLKEWYPTGKNLLYSDDEAGATFTTSEFASQALGGMGDLFVYDMYESVLVTAGHALNIAHEGTYYWHEK